MACSGGGPHLRTGGRALTICGLGLSAGVAPAEAVDPDVWPVHPGDPVCAGL